MALRMAHLIAKLMPVSWESVPTQQPKKQKSTHCEMKRPSIVFPTSANVVYSATIPPSPPFIAQALPSVE